MLKSYPHQMVTTVLSSDSLQLPPFSKWEVLLMERIFFPLKAVP